MIKTLQMEMKTMFKTRYLVPLLILLLLLTGGATFHSEIAGR